MVDTLGSRLAAAAGAIGTLAKDGYNKFHDYEYVTEASVKRAVGTALREHNLYVVSAVHEILPGGDFQHVLVRTAVTVGGVGLTETVTAVGIGSGTDKGDKAAFKAMAGGLKYALTSLFLIPTGDDAENDGGKKEDKPAETKAPKAAAKKPAKDEPSDPTGIAEAEKSSKTSAATALFHTNRIANATSEAELKTVAEDAAKDSPKMTAEDFKVVTSAFKARRAEVQKEKK